MTTPMQREANARHLLLALAVLRSGAPALAHSQAWLPHQGEAFVSVSYMFFDEGDHIFSSDIIDGETTRGYVAEENRWFLGDTFAHTVLMALDYGVLDRLALSGSVAYVTSKYEGRAPGNIDLDDGEYHGNLQDARFELRVKALERPVVATPFVGFLLPTHDYPTFGHTAIGHGLNEFQLGINLGRSLAPLLRNAYLHGAFSYGIAEKVADLRLSRTSFDVEAGYFLTRSFSLRVMATRMTTHGGLEWVSGDPNEPTAHSSGFTTLHNQVAAARAARLGFGASLTLFSDLSVFTSFFTTVWGENVGDGDFYSLGTSFRFNTPFARKPNRR